MSIETSQSSFLDHSAAFISSTDIDSGSAVTGKSGYGTTSNCGSRKSGNRSARHGRGGRGGRNNGGRSYQNSSPQNSSTGPSCQICNRTGHTALDCYHRMDFSYQGRHPPSQLAAMATSLQKLIKHGMQTQEQHCT
eukprot:TRINITY_DN17604_c0_g1_i1.p1 TRINITY_DN17604_c0_g1~~TRINITY_DN17604_c0_g1_i1.p1  ORF type:complete len:136 (-),score=27.05 TRINITY_DN17604_c0_g1_i1:1278-1685(-)